MKRFLAGFLIAVSFTAGLFASDTGSIVRATKTYVAQNSVSADCKVVVEKVSGDFARAKVTPRAGATDSAWIFLRKKEGAWKGVTMGTGFAPSDYKQFGIPSALWLK